MTDIVNRLRAPVSDGDDYVIERWPGEPPKKYYVIRLEAADEIERLRAALERIAFGKYHWEADAQEEARAALEGKHD